MSGTLDSAEVIRLVEAMLAQTATEEEAPLPDRWGLPFAELAASGPQIEALTPDQGPQGGGTRLTIHGQNFKPGCRVRLGGVEALGVVRVNQTEIQVIAPPQALPGRVCLSVSNPGEAMALLENRFTYAPGPLPAPVVDWVSICQSPVTGRAIVTVSGRNFVAGSCLRLGNTDAYPVSFRGSSTRLTGVIPIQAERHPNVWVVNPDGQSAFQPTLFDYVP